MASRESAPASPSPQIVSPEPGINAGSGIVALPPSMPRLPPPRSDAAPHPAPKPVLPPPAPSQPKVTPAPPQQNTGGGGGGKELTNPMARVALSYVGADPAAEAVWADAINDPTIPPNERKDLIEDLNEDGFPDPKNVTPNDLPLIASRIALIEQAAPFAMDQTNADAFAEAYKDLTNMLAKVTR
jgi:hypothetical protein